ncbi:hypothetical protein D0863_09364 [Hortaea werneckii]|uniref:AA9 family lytic polysaccharide monooxygenase n=1 Tax=Hortaea werneckii TaxID=91943 RepID=A0A3M7DLD8_HORWE|nr:hypothetical protein D0863_09364 [Hortaea werneckii]
MYSRSLYAALLAAPLTVQAHYIFSQLVINDEMIGGDYDYIRKNSNTYMPSYTDEVVNSPDLRCNKGASAGDGTQTYDVKAGDKVGFKLAYNEFIEHPGPGFVYMSLAPDGDVSSYEGDGDWFKVWESGMNGPASDENSWGTWQDDRIEFTIPAETPDGEYLVRPEHIAIHEGHVGKAQFYMECAQLRVSGGGSGSPGPMVKIPGLYDADSPSIDFSMWNGATSYEMPGPAVWDGGSSGSSSFAVSGSSDSTSSSESAYSSGSTQSPESSGYSAGQSSSVSSDDASSSAASVAQGDSSSCSQSIPVNNVASSLAAGGCTGWWCSYPNRI